MNDYLRARKRFGSLFPDLFIKRSTAKITQEVIDKQGLEVLRDGKRMFSLTLTMRKADVRTVLKSIKVRR